MSLPNLYEFHGDWRIYVDEIYEVFCNSVAHANLSFRGLKISCQYRPEYQGKHFGFWHMISENLDKNQSEDDRVPDMRRCERITWVAYLIQHAEASNEITWWENTRGRDTHVVIWHEQENFVVILAKRQDYYLLKTCYCAEEHRRRTFIKERAEYWGALKRLKPLKTEL